MRKRYSWDELVPIEETRLAAQYLVDTWNKIAESQPEKIRYSVHEPKLTERLSYYLDKFRADSGLQGFWINEAQEAIYDDEAEMADRIRKDITYLSNVSRRLFLIFEFKKLSKSSRSTYQGVNGMGRFVDGNYGVKQPLAVMVGIVKADSSGQDSIDSLYKSLCVKAIQSNLKMVHDKSGRYVLRPSGAIAGIAEFDTEHRRPPEKAPPNQTTTLAHVFVRCA